MSAPNHPETAVPVGVELSARTRVSLEQQGAVPVTLSHDSIQRLFALGLQTGPLPQQDTLPEALTLSIDGPVRYWVGNVEFGRRKGARALADGLVRAIEVGLDEHPTAPPKRSPRTPAGERPRQADETAVDVRVAVWLAADDLDSVLDVVATGKRVVLTDRGEPVGMLIGWGEYCTLREQQSTAEARYWASQREDRPTPAGAPRDATAATARGAGDAR